MAGADALVETKALCVYSPVSTDEPQETDKQAESLVDLYPTGPGYKAPATCNAPVHAKQQQQHLVIEILPDNPKQPAESYFSHMVLSCCVIPTFGLLCGLVAFLFAKDARKRAATTPNTARDQGTVSIVISILGIVTTGIVVCTILYYVFVCRYEVDEKCYSSRLNVSSPSDCERGRYFNGTCYIQEY